MLSATGPSLDMLDAITCRVAAGLVDDVLEELAREAPEEWEVVAVKARPLAGCCAWAIPCQCNGEDIYVVYRREPLKPRKGFKGKRRNGPPPIPVAVAAPKAALPFF
jgi:hypothetical protein